jgi:hypothetical protein
MTNQMPSGSENAELTQAKGTFTRLQVIAGFAFIGYLIWSINSVIQNPPVQTGLQLTQYWIIRSIGLILLPIFVLVIPSFLRKNTSMVFKEDQLLLVASVLKYRFTLARIHYSEVNSAWYRATKLTNRSKPTMDVFFVMKDKSRVVIRTMLINDLIVENLRVVGIPLTKLDSFLKPKGRLPKISKSELDQLYFARLESKGKNVTPRLVSHNHGQHLLTFSRAVSLIMVVYILLVNPLASSIDQQALLRSEEISRLAEAQDSLQIGVQVTSIDPVTKKAELLLTPIPTGNVGYAVQNGWGPSDDMYVSIGSSKRASELQQSNSFFFNTELQSNIAVTAAASDRNPLTKCVKWNVVIRTQQKYCEEWDSSQASLKNYPFDKYSFSLPIFNVEQRTSGADTESTADDVYKKVPITIYDNTSPINTWKIVVHPIAIDSGVTFQDTFGIADEFLTGNGQALVVAQRDQYTILLVLIVCLLMIASMISVISMGISVSLGFRPPTVAALVWAAALTFSLIQLRNLMPDSPPIGTTLDVVFYFPALLITIGGSVWILYYWIRRPDYGI